jgi:hypothetical protein
VTAQLLGLEEQGLAQSVEGSGEARRPRVDIIGRRAELAERGVRVGPQARARRVLGKRGLRLCDVRQYKALGTAGRFG